MSFLSSAEKKKIFYILSLKKVVFINAWLFSNSYISLNIQHFPLRSSLYARLRPQLSFRLGFTINVFSGQRLRLRHSALFLRLLVLWMTDNNSRPERGKYRKRNQSLMFNMFLFFPDLHGKISCRRLGAVLGSFSQLLRKVQIAPFSFCLFPKHACTYFLTFLLVV